MGRLTFAVAVPVLAAVILAILTAILFALAFGGEGCRTHDGSALRWRAAGEAVVVQFVFGLCFAIALGALSRVVNRRLAAIGMPRLDKHWELLAILGFVGLSVAMFFGLSACRMAPYDTIGSLALWASAGCFAVYHVLLLVHYLQGLGKGP